MLCLYYVIYKLRNHITYVNFVSYVRCDNINLSMGFIFVTRQVLTSRTMFLLDSEMGTIPVMSSSSTTPKL
jgi:hypothetical protein